MSDAMSATLERIVGYAVLRLLPLYGDDFFVTRAGNPGTEGLCIVGEGRDDRREVEVYECGGRGPTGLAFVARRPGGRGVRGITRAGFIASREGIDSLVRFVETGEVHAAGLDIGTSRLAS